MSPLRSNPPDRVGGAADRLAVEAADAARARALMTDPDVVALRVERVRAQVDGLLWAGIVGGLAFTMVNVQTFAAAGAPAWSAAWLVAWLLDPMVSVVLLAVLRAEQVTARYQVALPVWARRTKWLTFAATYAMNTWTSWGLHGGPLSWSGIVLHSVPPLVVFAAAETGPGLRDRLTEAVHRAAHHSATGSAAPPAGLDGSRDAAATGVALSGSVHERSTVDTTGRVREPVVVPVHEAEGPSAADVPSDPVQQDVPPRTAAPRKAAPRRTAAPRAQSGRGGSGRGRPVPRRLLPEFVADARAALDSARAEGAPVEPTPAWVRRVTGCSAGTSVKVAAALRATATTTDTAAAPDISDGSAVAA